MEFYFLLDLMAALLIVILAILIIIRISISFETKHNGTDTCGISMTGGSKEIQADAIEVVKNKAGMLGIIADGIGRENTGKVSAQIALDTAADAFEPYQMLTNPEYFFRTVFREANIRIQKTIGERRGGACMGLVFLGDGELHYGLAGDIRIALLRNGELIPLSEGHTMDVLMKRAYEKGRASKREVIWSMEDRRRWNYLGMDGFREVELLDRPIKLKEGDKVLMFTRGIWQELSWAEIEDIVTGNESLSEKARHITWAAQKTPGNDKENGSVVILDTEVALNAAD